jgi:peptidoglycan L-alanyl-D-glutamate endopeptidase CwlK
VHFLKSKELGIKEALLEGNLKTTRKPVNGGTHGFDRFENAFTRGESLILKILEVQYGIKGDK